MKLALAGNPNAGKTTVFNALTGRNERVGNWSGVTVEKKEHLVKQAYADRKRLTLADLPGAYSISPFTAEEGITRAYILDESPDVLINVVDATNLSRSLYFTTQLLELGIPAVIALNKSDVRAVDADALAKHLGCPVIPTDATSGKGLKTLISVAARQVGVKQIPPFYDGGKGKETDRSRFAYAERIAKTVEGESVSIRALDRGDKIDNILLDRRFGIPIFAAMMWLVFQISQTWVGSLASRLLVGWLEEGQALLRSWLAPSVPLLSALLVDGVLGGVIAVIGFLPLVMVLYFLLALLEDCGYMSRVAALLDPIFKRVGLSGKAVIPFVMAVGCAVPGIMASRTIRNEKERRVAAMLAPFMPCGAKTPIIALVAGAFFNNAGWVSTAMYLSGILIIFLAAWLIHKFAGHQTKSRYFIIELPRYKVPSFRGAFRAMCGRGRDYIVKASTIVLLCNTAVQVMQNFDWFLRPAESAETSILAGLARPFAYLLIPVVGYRSWQLAAAAITGFIAKENVVGTLAVCYGITDFLDGKAQASAVIGLTPVAALAYLVFNLFSPPCFAAIGAMNAEIGDRKWFWSGIALQFGVGFGAGGLVYQIGTLLTCGRLARGAVGGAVLLVGAIFAFIPKRNLHKR